MCILKPLQIVYLLKLEPVCLVQSFVFVLNAIRKYAIVCALYLHLPDQGLSDGYITSPDTLLDTMKPFNRQVLECIRSIDRCSGTELLALLGLCLC